MSSSAYPDLAHGGWSANLCQKKKLWDEHSEAGPRNADIGSVWSLESSQILLQAVNCAPRGVTRRCQAPRDDRTMCLFVPSLLASPFLAICQTDLKSLTLCELPPDPPTYHSAAFTHIFFAVQAPIHHEFYTGASIMAGAHTTRCWSASSQEGCCFWIVTVLVEAEPATLGSPLA